MRCGCALGSRVEWEPRAGFCPGARRPALCAVQVQSPVESWIRGLWVHTLIPLPGLQHKSGGRRMSGPRPDAGRLCPPPTPGGVSHPLSQIPPPRGRNVPRGPLKFDFELSRRQTSWSTIRELVGNPGESQSRSTGPCVLGRTCVHPQSLRLSTSFQKGT